MEEEVARWWEQARSDLKAARNSLKTKNYDWSCFQSQQAAEKALKAHYFKVFREVRKVHDLTFLAVKLNFPPEILEFCDKLNKIYIGTRYPDADEEIPAKKFARNDARQCIQLAAKIIQWLKKRL